MTKPPLTPQQAINEEIQRQLRKKHKLMAEHVAAALEAQRPGAARAAQQAIRRVEKSIALRVAKALCPHIFITKQPARVPGNYNVMLHCPACKTTTLSK